MTKSLFNGLESETTSDAILEQLANHLCQEQRFAELFESRLMQSRHRLGLPLDERPALDDLDEPIRTEIEEAYIDACREVGRLLLAHNELRQAWTYLRPIGDKQMVADAVALAEPTDDTLDELVEIALHEGVAPDRGFELVLQHYGTCNAITTFESVMPSLAIEHQRAAAERLVRHLHAEVLENVRAHIEQHERNRPDGNQLTDLLQRRGWLFENDGYHVDLSHLAATVRFARLIEDEAPLRLAVDLAEYGRQLAASLQLAGEEPFVDLYAGHSLFFSAQLGKCVDEAVAHFADRAQAVDAYSQGSGAIEAYLILLARLGRFDDALEASASLAPPDITLSSYAPTMLWLARRSGSLDRYLSICEQREDLLGYAAGLVERSE